MLKHTHITILPSSKNLAFWKALGYTDAKMKHPLQVKPEHLTDGIQAKVDVICDRCSTEYNIIYAKYVKNKNRNGYYKCNACGISDKTDRFKDNNPSLNPQYQKKKKETWIANYGFDNPSKSEVIKDKKAVTTMANYGVSNILGHEESMREGMMKKFGVEYPSQSPDIRVKMVKYLNENYGVSNISQIPAVKEKKISTCLKNYGVEHPSQSELIRRKQKETCFLNHGVYYPMQSPEVFKKRFPGQFYKISKYNDTISYQSSYELDFIKHLEGSDLLHLLEDTPTIDYVFEAAGTKHKYHPDFFIPSLNLVVEIKSTYTYEAELAKNLMKQKYTLLAGYNFLFIVDKTYEELDRYLQPSS